MANDKDWKSGDPVPGVSTPKPANAGRLYGAVALAGLACVLLVAKCVAGRASASCDEAIARVEEAMKSGALAAADVALPEAKIRCSDRPTAITELEEKLRSAAPKSSAVAEMDANKRAAEAKMDAAAKVWKTYEALPAAKRTKDMWKDALAESVALGRDIGPPMDRIFQENNLAIARKNMAPLINAESVATGDMFTVLVPSPDPTKCALWGSMWSQDAESLSSVGFRRVHCEGARRKSGLTGETIQEPAVDWNVE